MTTTTNLALPLIESGQLQPDVTANEQATGIDAAMCESTDIACNDGATVVTAAQVREAARLVLTAGTLTAAFDVTLPAVKRLLAITNSTSFDATIACVGTGEATVPAGESAIVYCDATDVSAVAGGGSGTPVSQPIQIACSDETTALTTGAAKVTFRVGYAFTLTAVRASVTTAPTGAALSIGINENGVSILSTDLTIDAGEKTSTTAAVPAVISDASLADDAEITIDIDQVGSTVAGAGLKVTLIGYPT